MSKSGKTAADLIAVLPEQELAALFSRYGEELFARRIARAIVRARESGPVDTTGALAELVKGPFRRRPGGMGIPPAACSRRCASRSMGNSTACRKDWTPHSTA